MFLDESAFDVDDAPTMIVPKLSTSNPAPAAMGGGGRYGNATTASSEFNSRPGSSGLGATTSSTSSSLHAAMALMNVDDDPDSPMASSGANSRARMLAQQRELQLKKRQSAIQNGGMVRSSIDNDEGGSTFRAPMGAAASASSSSVNSSTSQFTPAIRQFSAPKAVKETFADDPAGSKESAPVAKIGLKSVKRIPMNDADDFEDEAKTGSRTKGESKGWDEDEEDEDDPPASYPRRGSAAAAATSSKSRSSRRNDDDDDVDDRGSRRRKDDDDDDDWNDRRRGDRDRDRTRSTRSGSGRSGSRREVDEDEYDDGYRRGNGEPRSTSKSSSSRHRDRDRDRGYDFDGEEEGGRGYRGSDRDRDGDRSSRKHRDKDRDRDRDRDREPRSSRDNYAGGNGGGNGGGASSSRGWGQAVGGPASLPRAVATEIDPATVRTVPPDLTNMRRFLTTPIPKECGVIQCYIRRNKSGVNKLFPMYSLYMKDGDSDRFLMCSKKRPNNKTSNYLISMAEGDMAKGSDNYLGKLRSNFVGTEFQFFDDGVNPADVDPSEATSDKARLELGSVMYAPNMLGSRGPRKMQVCIPVVSETGDIVRPKNAGVPFAEGEFLVRMREQNFRDLFYFINKPPRWNEQVQAYVLNFNGRVTMASVKNFQLIDPEEQNTVVLQFGRVAKDDFTMDMRWPFTPLQAFAVTLSSFDSKIACD